MSQISAPSSDVYRLSAVGPSDKSSVWNVTPTPSVRSPSYYGQPAARVPVGVARSANAAERTPIDVDSESWISRQAHRNEHWEPEEQQQPAPTDRVPERRRRKVLKKKSAPPPPVASKKKSNPAAVPNSVVPARKAAEHSRETVQRVPDVEVIPEEEDGDSYFDDESFDTFVESSSSSTDGKAASPPPPVPPRTRTSSQASSPGVAATPEASLRRWLEEQSGLVRRSDHSDVTSDSRSFFSSVSQSTAPPGRPPKLSSRPSSVTSADTVKRRPPPPVPPTEQPKVYRKKKPPKKGSTPGKKVADVESESSRRLGGKSGETQRNNDAAKSSSKKGKKKKKNGDVSVERNGEVVYSNVANSAGKRQPVDSSSVSSWATSDTRASEQKSPRSVHDTCQAQLSPPAGRSPQPLVFEKVTIQDDQIASDYLFHKSVAELNSASAENILNVVGRKTTPVHSPESVFQYAVTSSFVYQNSPPPQGVVQQQQQQQLPAVSYHPQAAVISSAQPQQRQILQQTEDDLPPFARQHPQPIRPPTYVVPQPSSSRPESSSPDERSSGSIYDTLDDDRFNSGVSEDQMPAYGLNRRTVAVKSDDARPLGLRLCGGNVSGTFVRQAAPNSAAAAAGLTVGDWIVAVGGRVVKSLSKQEVLQRIEELARDSAVRLVVDRDDDRFKLAAPSNALGDSFHVRAHYSYSPGAKKSSPPGADLPPGRGDSSGTPPAVGGRRELTVSEGDVFLVSDSLPEDAVGYWVAKKVGGVVGEPEGLIPNGVRAEQIVTRQRLTASPSPSRARGGVFARSFRARSSKSSSGDHDQDSAAAAAAADSRPSSECGDAAAYVRVVEQATSVRRPVVIMGLFCDAVCAMLADAAPRLFEVPRTAVERRRASSYEEEFSPSTLDLAAIRAVVGAGRHCAMVVSPRAVQFLRDATDLRPIVIYMSPASKNVLKSMVLQLAPACDKKPAYMLVEAAKFERHHAALFDAVVPYKPDGSWLDLLKDTVARLQRARKWIPAELVDDRDAYADGAPPDIIRTTTWNDDDRR